MRLFGHWLLIGGDGRLPLVIIGHHWSLFEPLNLIPFHSISVYVCVCIELTAGWLAGRRLVLASGGDVSQNACVCGCGETSSVNGAPSRAQYPFVYRVQTICQLSTVVNDDRDKLAHLTNKSNNKTNFDHHSNA